MCCVGFGLYVKSSHLKSDSDGFSTVPFPEGLAGAELMTKFAEGAEKLTLGVALIESLGL